MMTLEEIRRKIEEAEMILVGLGEEYQHPANVREMPESEKGKTLLQEAGLFWLLPMWDDYCEHMIKSDTAETLKKLADMLNDKNYFVVSVAMNHFIVEVPWKEGRLVMPCGSSTKLQCAGGCGEKPIPLSERHKRLLEEIMCDLYHGKLEPEKINDLGNCEKCNASLILNNIYAEHYNEDGYMEQWNLYTKWLQGTLNRNVLILELGVGMKFPSVIRFPFEKIAYFNQKAQFYRINEKLYQMTEELCGKGYGLSQNAIDCLRNL